VASLGAAAAAARPSTPANPAAANTTPAGGTASATTTSPAASNSSNPSTSATGATPPGATAKLTAPGAMLKPGETASVDYDTTLANGNDGPNYRLQVTIEAITAGSIGDFKGISLSGVPKGSTPTYVKLQMTNLGGHAINTSSDDPANAVQAIEHNGQMDNNLILTGYFPPCPNANTPNPFPAGQSFTTCETFMEHGEATQIGDNGSNSTLDSPVIWSP
jgi:hypothetical protein